MRTYLACGQTLHDTCDDILARGDAVEQRILVHEIGVAHRRDVRQACKHLISTVSSSLSRRRHLPIHPSFHPNLPTHAQ